MRYLILCLCAGCFSPATGYVLESRDPMDLVAVKGAAMEWSRATGEELTVRIGAEASGGEFLISWRHLEDQMAGDTDYYDRIIKLNSNPAVSWYKGECECDGVDLQTLVAHEIGHSLDRHHTGSPNDTMFGHLDWCSIKHELTNADVNQ